MTPPLQIENPAPVGDELSRRRPIYPSCAGPSLRPFHDDVEIEAAIIALGASGEAALSSRPPTRSVLRYPHQFCCPSTR